MIINYRIGVCYDMIYWSTQESEKIYLLSIIEEQMNSRNLCFQMTRQSSSSSSSLSLASVSVSEVSPDLLYEEAAWDRGRT
mmetsp:Transcript_586/g.1512  ORF Transcript_586/g.1512 Transcript_586/m.1512 type:complete len:81 (-) Transcript_586:1407-1649(-)